MSSPEPLPLEDRPGAPGPLPEACGRPGEPARNGAEPAAAPAPAAAAGAAEDRAPVDRAEEAVDRFAMQVATFTAFLGRKIIHAAARVREEAEDLWAEAQNIRRGDKKP